ncbi:unnamed protein product [Vitrella brassicaformis CCMP3155]|uniref:Uncharacterized protein n=1 Tax=Vitrella brassicaformis (strain CCMP3155) TaxID=1169540 RepID=A0A0G4ER26_VITBC|nr:unnamed protein product [Vitrella brassicaformis CCMP3155]|eukprot:CEL99934.1 unnamed protein product [Vitrella brassicaformis CCMP3155]
MGTDQMLSLESPEHPPEATAQAPILSLAGLAERSSSGSAPSDSVRPKRVTVGLPKVVPPTLEGLLPERALKGRPSTLSPSEREPLTVSTAGSPSPRKGVRLSLGRSGSDIGAGTSEVVSSSSQHGGAFPFVDSSGHSDLDAMRRAITSVPSPQGSGASHGGLSQSFTSSQGESAASRRESAASASGAANEGLVTAAKIVAQLLSENEQFRQHVLICGDVVSAMDRSPGQRLDASGRSSQQRRKSAFATMDSGLLSMGSLDEISESYERQMETMESDESDKARQEEEPRKKGLSSRRGSLTTSSRQRMSVGEQQRRKSAFATMDSGLLSMGRLLLLSESIDKARQEEEQLQKQLRNANEDLKKLSNTMDTEEYKRLQERYEEKEAELATVKRQVNEHKRGEENAKRKNTELQQEEHERALDRKRPEVVEAQRKAHEVTEQLQRLKAVFKAKEREMDDDVKRAEQGWAEASKRALQLHVELNKLKSVLDDYNSKAANLTNLVRALEAKESSFSESLQDLRSQLATGGIPKPHQYPQSPPRGATLTRTPGGTVSPGARPASPAEQFQELVTELQSLHCQQVCAAQVLENLLSECEDYKRRYEMKVGALGATQDEMRASAQREQELQTNIRDKTRELGECQQRLRHVQGVLEQSEKDRLEIRQKYVEVGEKFERYIQPVERENKAAKTQLVQYKKDRIKSIVSQVHGMNVMMSEAGPPACHADGLRLSCSIQTEISTLKKQLVVSEQERENLLIQIKYLMKQLALAEARKDQIPLEKHQSILQARHMSSFQRQTRGCTYTDTANFEALSCL